MKAVCKDCEDRRVGCHAVCARFLAESIMRDKKNRERQEKYHLEKVLDGMDIARRIAKKKKRRTGE